MKVVPLNEKPALLVRVRLAEPERIGLPRLATFTYGASLTTIDILQECYAKVKIDDFDFSNFRLVGTTEMRVAGTARLMELYSFQLTTSPLFFPICVLAEGASLHRFRSYPAPIVKPAPWLTPSSSANCD
jgi:hypothetical protein